MLEVVGTTQYRLHLAEEEFCSDHVGKLPDAVIKVILVLIPEVGCEHLVKNAADFLFDCFLVIEPAEIPAVAEAAAAD